MPEHLFERVAIIGIGLIGSSLAYAIRKHGAARTVVAYDRVPDVRSRAMALGLAEHVEDNAKAAVEGADLVILCVPVGAIAAVMEDIAPHLSKGVIVTDVGSVKHSVVQDVMPRLPSDAQFVPGHPIAGTENSGPEAGFAELFEERWCILTPEGVCDDVATEQVAALWQRIGSSVDIMSPEHHDLVCAVTSHLPHLIAYNIVGTAADLEEVTKSEVIKYSAAGFRDFTRLAASDPTMWRDVFLNNKEAVLEMLGRFSEDLAALQRAIRWSDGEALFELFTRTREIRRGIIQAGQETDEPDFGRGLRQHQTGPASKITNS